MPAKWLPTCPLALPFWRDRLAHRGGTDAGTVEPPSEDFSAVGFEESGYNEAEHAKAVAAHLGTDHTELYVSALQARDIIPRLAPMYGEPFGDPSAIPTFLISQLAKQHVTVALSGDGGDELFGGYGRYFNHKAARFWRVTRSLPAPLRAAIAAALQSGLTIIADHAVHGIRKSCRRSMGKSLRAKTDLLAALSTCQTQDTIES